MARYDYKCNDCNNDFVYQTSMFSIAAKEDIVECPNCASKNVRRVITTAPVVTYKGKGFYTTDNKSTG